MAEPAAFAKARQRFMRLGNKLFGKARENFPVENFAF